MFEYKYISILNVCELKHENANGQCGIFTLLKFEYVSINFEYYKSFEHKISKGKYTCNIRPGSDSNSESDSDSDRVERIVGSSSNSSELNDSGDQAADSQQEQDAEETIPESSTSRYGRKRTRVPRENYLPWHNIHVEM